MEVLIPIFAIGSVSALLVAHDDYDDGLIGRVAFFLVILSSAIVLLGKFTGAYIYQLPLEMDLLLAGVALFMVRHAWRFMHYHKSRKYSWDGEERRKRQ